MDIWKNNDIAKFLILSNFTLLKVNLSIIVMIIIILYYRRTKTTTEGRTTILNSRFGS